MTLHATQLAFRWTHHPFVDSGIASLMVFAGRDTPAELGREDLEKFASYAEVAYFSPELASALTVLFTVNFINPHSGLERQKRLVSEVLRLFDAQPAAGLNACTFCADPAVRTAHRDLVPLLGGRQTVNFFPGGQPGLPVCGKCISALQALSIGAPVIGGKAVVIACDDPQITVQFVRRWQPAIQERIRISIQTQRRLPPVANPLTRTVQTLEEMGPHISDQPVSVTTYCFSNSGQGPDLRISFLAPEVVRFVMRARSGQHNEAWNKLVNSEWEAMSDSVGLRGQERHAARNFLYEDLYGLPEGTGQFVFRYFRGHILRAVENGYDPKHYMALLDEFLETVAPVYSVRFTNIRGLAGRLAQEIIDTSDRRSWQQIHSVETPAALGMLLRRLRKHTWHGTFLSQIKRELSGGVLDHTEPAETSDWTLIWSLIVMATVEKLFQWNWFSTTTSPPAGEESPQDRT